MYRNLHKPVRINSQRHFQYRHKCTARPAPCRCKTVQQNIFIKVSKTYMNGLRNDPIILGLECHDLQVAAVRKTVRFEILAGREILYLRRIGNVPAFVRHLERGRIRTVRRDTRSGRHYNERIGLFPRYDYFHRIRLQPLIRSFELIFIRQIRGKRMHSPVPGFSARLIDNRRQYRHILPLKRHGKSSPVSPVIHNGLFIHRQYEFSRNGYHLNGHLIRLLSIIRSDKFVTTDNIGRKFVPIQYLAGSRIGD